MRSPGCVGELSLCYLLLMCACVLLPFFTRYGNGVASETFPFAMQMTADRLSR